MIDIAGHDGYDVLRTDVTAEEVERLFNIGCGTRRRIEESVHLRRARFRAPLGLSEFVKRYGDPDAFETVMASLRAALCQEMQATIDAVRVGLYLPFADASETWGLGYSVGYALTDPEYDCRFQRDTIIGLAATSARLTVKDFSNSLPSEVSPTTGGRFRESVKTVVAIPIQQYCLDPERSEHQAVPAVLVVDSNRTLLESGFVRCRLEATEGTTSELEVSPALRLVLREWVKVLSRVLQA
jgi:hypothetical protein